MNRTTAKKDEIKALVLKNLFAIAPDLKGESINISCNFRDEYDLDSMDFLHFIIAVHKETGIEIPEADYPQLATVNGCIDYLFARQR